MNNNESFHPYITTFDVMYKAGWGRPAPCAECGKPERNIIHRYQDWKMSELNRLYKAALAETFAKQVVATLNRALLADPEAIQKLFAVRVHCNKELVNDLTIQVHPEDDGKYTIGLLGLINGMIGMQPGTSTGFVASIVEGEKGVVFDDRIQRFECLSDKHDE